MYLNDANLLYLKAQHGDLLAIKLIFLDLYYFQLELNLENQMSKFNFAISASKIPNFVVMEVLLIE